MASQTLPTFNNTPARQGALAAARAFNDGITGNVGAFNATIFGVTAGPAPQEFKDEFTATLDRLIAATAA